MRPLFDWTVKRGFLFGQTYPPGFGSLTGQTHIGVDFLCKSGTMIYAPFDGLCTQSVGNQGGNTLTLVSGGLTFRFLHLSKFLKTGWVKEGDIIGLTGNTGAVTTTPHLHLDLKVNNKFVDPTNYLMPATIPLTIVGSPVPGLKEQVEKWSKGFFTIEVKMVPMILPYDPAVDYSQYVQGRYCLISCSPGPQIYKTTLTDGLKTAYAIVGTDALSCSYEVSHCLGKWYNAHRGTNPYIEIEDTVGGVLDEQRYRKYDVMKPYTGIILGPDTAKVMTAEEVKNLYRLAFYRLPDAGELAFWTGKVLGDFLKTAIKDRAQFLSL